MEKKTFLFYTSWKKNIDMMDDVELRRFINNLCNYAENKEIDLPTRVDKMVWNDVVELLNHNENKRQRIIEKRKEAGSKGGAPVGNTNAQKKIDVEETTKNNQNNQMVEKQPKQTKQPDICNMKKEEGDMLKEEGDMLKEEGNRMNEIRNRILDIMKQVIEEGIVEKEDVEGWKLSDTRNLLNDMLSDYPNWEQDLLNLGIDSFIKKLPLKSKIEIDYILYSTLKAHLIL